MMEADPQPPPMHPLPAQPPPPGAAHTGCDAAQVAPAQAATLAYRHPCHDECTSIFHLAEQQTSRQHWQPCRYGVPGRCGHPAKHLLLHLPASVQAWAQQQWAKHFSVETFDKLSHKRQKKLEGKVLCPASPECLDGLEAELINAGYERNDEHPAPSCFCPLCARQWELDDAARLEKERKEAERKEAAARREAEKERKEEAAKQRRDAAAAAAAERAQKEAEKKAAAAAKGKAVSGSSAAQMAAARGQRISWDADASDEEGLFSAEELAAGKSSFRGGGKNKAPAPNQVTLMQSVWQRVAEYI